MTRLPNLRRLILVRSQHSTDLPSFQFHVRCPTFTSLAAAHGRLAAPQPVCGSSVWRRARKFTRADALGGECGDVAWMAGARVCVCFDCECVAISCRTTICAARSTLSRPYSAWRCLHAGREHEQTRTHIWSHTHSQSYSLV